jgi:hypothetical protein
VPLYFAVEAGVTVCAAVFAYFFLGQVSWRIDAGVQVHHQTGETALYISWPCIFHVENH